MTDWATIDETRERPPGCGPIWPVAAEPAAPLRQQVFEAVRSAGQISRAEMAKSLNVSPGTVTPIVSDLIAEGYLEETQATEAPSGRGRPPVALRVRPEAGYVVGMKLSDEVHTAVLVDFAGEPVAEAMLPLRDPQKSMELRLNEAEALFADLLGQSGLAREQILSVGLGLPGVIDTGGRVIWSPVSDRRDVPLRDLAEARLGLPVHVDNDANLLTMAELWFGAGRTMSDFCVVTIEHGVGMGLVLNHRLHRGAGGQGMELGHTKVQMDGALCRCGSRGCAEAYVADYALVREAGLALRRPHSAALGGTQATLEALFEQARAGNETARAIFHRAGRYLALILANTANLFDPSLIILSGSRMRYDYLYAEEVLALMRDWTLNEAPKIEINAWGDHVWARGGAALALERVTASLIGRGAS
ncbi:ROK family protein [Roseicyclus sp. F158]|uniref:ROK family protein n=1 Tax=Tropicimonas omnivorans TaxID=3075590 RepID=A0ABU3DFJ8_9RHOB|nr:ROK family protein [Roseicyclus sp. F158]MDT0682488.1 ROK family protein [Roseicyclus sp. F158]